MYTARPIGWHGPPSHIPKYPSRAVHSRRPFWRGLLIFIVLLILMPAAAVWAINQSAASLVIYDEIPRPVEHTLHLPPPQLSQSTAGTY